LENDAENDPDEHQRKGEMNSPDYHSQKKEKHDNGGNLVGTHHSFPFTRVDIFRISSARHWRLRRKKATGMMVLMGPEGKNQLVVESFSLVAQASAANFTPAQVNNTIMKSITTA
jgi:hypothetical protein